MGYPKDLEECSESELQLELTRRFTMRRNGKCDYCTAPLRSEPACRFSERHNWPQQREPKRVRHSDLKRYSDDSAYKSVCPECGEGILGMRRDRQKFELEHWDNCPSCGQVFIYEDIEELRKKERGEPR